MKSWRELGGKVGVSEWEYKTKSKGYKPVLKDKEALRLRTPDDNYSGGIELREVRN